jgi:uncharacterized protein (TIGR02328 family)
MRFWHKDLIDVLPKPQLTGQWRECNIILENIIRAGAPQSLIVNKVMDYPCGHLVSYVRLVYDEMLKRGYRPNPEIIEKCFRLPQNHFKDNDLKMEINYDNLFSNWHNDRYLRQCYYNLQEKYDCGGIKESDWHKIDKKVKNLMQSTDFN